ncbi:MAG: hypothetical protein M3Y48_10400 [Actinomycetota bacterium]|nr:hypothetical protein [Actinomycetota bacterium]
MPDPAQSGLDPIRVALDHGEVVELDGGTVVLDGEESPSVVLRLAPWRAQSVARVLQEWSSVSRIFHHPTRPHLDELDLSRTLELAAAVLAGGDEPTSRSPGGSHVIPHRQPLAAVAVLGERAAHLSAVQRLALVDAAAWWLSKPNGGEEFAYALLAASCGAQISTEHVYLALITPSEKPDEDGEVRSS